jgi:hypothetical protein
MTRRPKAVPGGWLERASDLIAEPDPGPTPYLVEGLITEGAITELVGPFKVGKTWNVLELILAVTGARPAFGRYKAKKTGQVLAVFEESGRYALHRRLRALQAGYGIEDEQLTRAMKKLRFATNAGVQLTNPEWQAALIDKAVRLQKLRLIVFDPLARIKGNADENSQKELAPILDFLRVLREKSGAAVAFVHHTGYEPGRARGTSDLEAYWESRLLIEGKHGSSRPHKLTATHREAESTVVLEYRIVGSNADGWVVGLAFGAVGCGGTCDQHCLLQRKLHETAAHVKEAYEKQRKVNKLIGP